MGPCRGLVRIASFNRKGWKWKRFELLMPKTEEYGAVLLASCCLCRGILIRLMMCTAALGCRIQKAKIVALFV